MRQKYRSLTDQLGEPVDHLAAKTYTYGFLVENIKNPNWSVRMERDYPYTSEFIKAEHLERKEHKNYKCDIAIELDGVPLLCIEIAGNIGYRFAFPGGFKKKVRANYTRHSSKAGQLKDGLNKSFVEKIYGAVYIILLKEKINGDADYIPEEQDRIKERENYLRREIPAEFLK